MSVAVRDLPLWALSWVVWKVLPGRASMKMAEFSHVEAGSGLDMLAAVQETPRRELRYKYWLHALDELKHSRLFAERASALAPGRNRTRAVLDDSGFITEHGINTKQSLFSELGETEFLAFVWVHEKRGAQQFDLYADLLSEDDATRVMFAEIAKDERFHIAYSRTELDLLEKHVGSGPVRWAVLKVRARRAWQGWLRFARGLGEVVTAVWLHLIYFLLLGPFSLIARWRERPADGFVAAPDRPPAAERAREMG